MKTEILYNAFMALLHCYLLAAKWCTSPFTDSKPVATFKAHHEQLIL